MGLLNLIRRNAGPAPDPNPGEGGYTGARGPAGEGGYPGSTGQRRTNPPEAGGKLHDDPTGYGVEPDARRGAAFVAPSRAPAPEPQDRTRRGRDRGWRPPQVQQADLQADPAEWFGGRHLRTVPGVDDVAGGTPLRQAQQAGGHSVRDTETPGSRDRPVISRNIPGDEYDRPHARQFFKGKAARPDGENRFVFAGANGGQMTYSFDARMPYTGRGNGARGADLNADRYYSPQTDYFGDQGGQYGYAREVPDGQHRPTEYYEPGPWSANFYDTTAEAGSPAEAGQQSQAYDAVSYSPPVGGRRRG